MPAYQEKLHKEFDYFLQQWREPFFGGTVHQWKEDREKAYSKFRHIFEPSSLADMTEEDFHSFLDFNVNKSWTGLRRRGMVATRDMAKLREAISFLQDESLSIKDRVSGVLSKDGRHKIPGMGKNIATAILHIVNPDKYCVWNNRLEESLKKLGKMPRTSGDPGETYQRLNEVSAQLAKALNTDLTTFDMFMYYISSEGGSLEDSKRPEDEGPLSPVDFSPRPTRTSSFPPELEEFYDSPQFIGRGGFARVFKAKRKSDGEWVAVKVPISLDASTGRSFIKEITAWQRLSHPNIVKLYDMNILPIPYIEMELCESRCLEDVEKPLEVEEAAGMVFDIAEGLKHAHSKNRIHRDLKPGNILFKDGVPKITDWGLSKVTVESRHSTNYGFSPMYASPELLSPDDFGRPDERTDIYQLGVIFYELVTGKPPFHGRSLAGIMSAVITKEPESPSDLNPDAEGVEQIIIRCMKKKKVERFRNIGEMQRSLAEYLDREYKTSLKMSISAGDFGRSAYYCVELCLMHAACGNISEAQKYANDLKDYSSGEVKEKVSAIVEKLKFCVKEGVGIGEDELNEMKVVLHRVRMERMPVKKDVMQERKRREELERLKREREEREKEERRKREEERERLKREEEERQRRRQKEQREVQPVAGEVTPVEKPATGYQKPIALLGLAVIGILVIGAWYSGFGSTGKVAGIEGLLPVTTEASVETSAPTKAVPGKKVTTDGSPTDTQTSTYSNKLKLSDYESLTPPYVPIAGGGLKFDANGDGDLKDSYDYVLYDGVYIIDGGDGIIRMGYNVQNHYVDGYYNPADGPVAGEVVKIKGSKYAITDVSDFDSGEIDIGPVITKRIRDTGTPDRAVTIAENYKVFYNQVVGTGAGTIYFYEGNALLDTYTIPSRGITKSTKLNDKVDIGGFEDIYHIYLIKQDTTEGWVTMSFVYKDQVVTLKDKNKGVFGYDHIWINNANWPGEIVFVSPQIQLIRDGTIDLEGTYYQLKWAQNKELDIIETTTTVSPILGKK